MPLKVGHDDDLPSRRLNFVLPDDFSRPPVATLDQYVRDQSGDNLLRRLLGEGSQVIDGPDGFEDFPSLGQRKNRPRRPLELADGSVIVERHNEDIAVLLGLLEEPDMAGVNQVKAAVGENHFLALLLELPADFEKFPEFIDFSLFQFFCHGLFLSFFAGRPHLDSGRKAPNMADAADSNILAV